MITGRTPRTGLRRRPRLAPGGVAHPPAGGAGSSIDGSGGPPHDSGMEGRVAKLEGAYESLKVVRPMTIGVLGIGVAAIIGGFAFLGTQMASLSGQITSLRAETNAGFSAIRAEMREDRAAVAAQVTAIRVEMREDRAAAQAAVAAQVTAIANAVTATRQEAPQVILVPAPAVVSPQRP